MLENPAAGTYRVSVLAWLVTPGGTYDGKATLSVLSPPQPDPGSVKWSYDTSAPQASVEVPLRVVLVGFAPGELDTAKLLAEIPNLQRPGVLIPRGSSPSADEAQFPLGTSTLVNHGRAYYGGTKPFLVPYEYRWKPKVIHAPAAFAAGLFAAMRANSTTGDFAKPANRAYLEGYNASRGNFRGFGNTVAPNAPVRFVDGEKTEDWIAANSKQHLGWDDPARGKGPGSNPGYTVYVLNTWDSAEARAHIKPSNEYHVFKINRTDPDTGDFDGIDWARIWGGRYRFMMVDLGAAPNPYEAETWGNRGRSVNGSATYDPPLWEYRAKAPRPVTVVNAFEGWEQAVTPGATWDVEQLQRMIARTVNQAASFRFLHSYLYEPHPATGRYWFSDNVWHDANAELPWASDLQRLYNQDVVLGGLRTLTPYLEFAGDVKFEYLAQGGTDFAADQAMLEQAKQDGDDVAGAPGVSMHTLTAMDYLDSKPERFLRGGSCYTTVPGINVVAEKHYAWALPIAAGHRDEPRRRAVGLPELRERRLQDAEGRPRPDDGDGPSGGLRRRVHLHGRARGEPLPRARAPARLRRRDAQRGRLAALLRRVHVGVQLDRRADDVLAHRARLLDPRPGEHRPRPRGVLLEVGGRGARRGRRRVLRRRQDDGRLAALQVAAAPRRGDLRDGEGGDVVRAVRLRPGDVRGADRVAQGRGVPRPRARARARLDRDREGDEGRRRVVVHLRRRLPRRRQETRQSSTPPSQDGPPRGGPSALRSPRALSADRESLGDRGRRGAADEGSRRSPAGHRAPAHERARRGDRARARGRRAGRRAVRLRRRRDLQRGAERHRRETPLAFIPGGGTSVLPRALGLPRDPVAAARRLAGSGAPRKIAVGRVNGHRFGFACGIGLDAEVVRAVDELGRRADGRRPSNLAFAMTGLRTLSRHRFQLEPEVEVMGLGRAAPFVLVSNAPAYTYAGPIAVQPARSASFEGGLDLVAPLRLRRRDLPAALLLALGSRDPARARDVLYAHDADRLEVVCDRPLPLQADGEDLGDVEHAVFEAERDAVTVLA